MSPSDPLRLRPVLSARHKVKFAANDPVIPVVVYTAHDVLTRAERPREVDREVVLRATASEKESPGVCLAPAAPEAPSDAVARIIGERALVPPGVRRKDRGRLIVD